MAGQVAHHIQDMSSPPQVMPIFHMMFDRIDKYDSPPVNIGDHALICRDVQASPAGPYDLLEKAAQRTLGAVGEKVVFSSGATRDDETWMKFWGGPESRDYKNFRTYGAYGNRFGLVPPCKTPDCPPYDKEVFDAFYGNCYRRAVADTVRLLIYLDRREAGLPLPADGAAAMYHDFKCGN
jgi:hypothetical protein